VFLFHDRHLQTWMDVLANRVRDVFHIDSLDENLNVDESAFH
jgi:hypothetical protein